VLTGHSVPEFGVLPNRYFRRSTPTASTFGTPPAGGQINPGIDSAPSNVVWGISDSWASKFAALEIRLLPASNEVYQVF
jgi:hypothetical protein